MKKNTEAYQRWLADPGAAPWRKSGYNPKSNYGMLKLGSAAEAGYPEDAAGWVMIFFPFVAVAVAALLGLL